MKNNFHEYFDLSSHKIHSGGFKNAKKKKSVKIEMVKEV